MLKSRGINGIEIFRPSEQVEALVYERIKGALFAQYPSGVYSDTTVVTNIVNTLFEAYKQVLDEYLPRVDHLAFATFLIREYEQYGRVAHEFKTVRLNAQDEELWQSYASHARRGIKYLLELICTRGLEAGTEVGSQDDQEQSLSILFLAAEELVSLYMRSHLYHGVLDEVTLVLDQSLHRYFYVEKDLTEPPFEMRADMLEAGKYIPEPNFLRDPVRHNQVLASSFNETFGVDYLNVLGALQQLIIEERNPEDEGEPCVISLANAVLELMLKLSISQAQAARILTGFTLTASQMEQDRRELFRPKQEYRAYKRGFFVFVHEGREMLLFSYRMARECLDLLIGDVPFRKLPSQWQTPAITSALNLLSLQAGRWFEQVVEANLKDVGIRGVGSVKRLVFKDGQRENIPPQVGEIDFLGYCPVQRMIVVVEVKQVSMATEPRMFMDDLSRFLTGSGNYAAKFQAKYRWVIDNQQRVSRFLEQSLACPVVADKVGYVMITHYSLYVARRIDAFSCVSLPEFMRRFQAAGEWPFSKTSLAPAD